MLKAFAVVIAGPWLLDAARIVAQSAAGPIATNVWDIGKDLSFAGLVFYLVGYSMPKMMAQHQAERLELVTAMDRRHKEQNEEMRVINERVDNRHIQNAQLLATISDEHARSAQSGHEAAHALATEIRALAESLK